MDLYWQIVIFVIGICVGSFVNMLVYRTEIKYKLKKPKFKIQDNDRSYCDYCGRQLHWYENIPVLSWVIQGGNSRCCQKKLPLQYPLLEIFMGVTFCLVGSLLFFEGWWMIILGLVMITFLIFSALFDFKHMILPDFSTVMLSVSALTIWVIRHGGDLAYIYSAIGSFVFLFMLFLITRGRGMGMGDVKYALFMGLFLGGAKTILSFYISFIVGAIFGLFLIISKGYKKNSKMPFGPFLIGGTIVSWLWGSSLLLYLYRWF